MTAPTEAELDEIERAAKAATPGSWVSGLDAVFSGAPPAMTVCEVWGPPSTSEPNAAFIAAANPAVVLRLVAEVRRLRVLENYAQHLPTCARRMSMLSLRRLPCDCGLKQALAGAEPGGMDK